MRRDRSMKFNILVVDDKPEMLRYIKSILEEFYTVYLIADGVTALAYLQNHTPDLIIIDINMPQMDGFTLLENIHTMDSLKSVPVIFLTASANPENEIRGLRLGAKDFISKPIRRESLLQRVQMQITQGKAEQEIKKRYEQMKQEAEKARIYAMQDELSGLWKRNYIKASAEQYIKKEKRPCALFMLDIDDFKRINDTYGHQTGDNLIKKFAFILQKNCTENMIISRVGGDEFCVFIPNVSDKGALSALADGIFRDLDTNVNMNNDTKMAGISMGIAVIPENGKTFEELYSAADDALLEAKRRGKNTYHFAPITHNATKHEKMDRVHDLLRGRSTDSQILTVKFGEIQTLYHFARLLKEKGAAETHVLIISLENIQKESRAELFDNLMHGLIAGVKNLTALAKNGNTHLVALVFDCLPEGMMKAVFDSIQKACGAEIAANLKIEMD
ncbi:MAG TPA: hypothetical protein DCY74_09700 [Clostridiales bacterium]|nr:hypothetical protein [Clostridiales bacterium]HCG35171.1 hypothetical protein [Clostridiales bacterium]